MDTHLIQETALKTLAGSISFPEVVGNLLRAGVEYYQVDYVGLRKTFYGPDGAAVVSTPITFGDLPAVASDFDVAEVRAAIFDSQRNGQHYRDFSRRVMTAGAQGYFAFLRGQRVTYFGRQGISTRSGSRARSRPKQYHEPTESGCLRGWTRWR